MRPHRSNSCDRDLASAFSLVEVVVALAILAFCFIPIVTQSRSTVKETEFSQEDLVARHYLIDLVERFKGSTLEELQLVSQDQNLLKSDEMLTDHARVLQEMETKAQSTGKLDSTAKGLRQFLDVVGLMGLTPSMKLEENYQGATGVHKVTFVLTWTSKLGKNAARKIEFAKILVIGT